MTFLIFAHIYSRHHVLVIEKEFGESLCQLCLSDTGSTHEKEGTDRSLFILKAGTRATYCIGNSLDGVILTDDALMKLRFHAQQLCPLAFQHSVYRDAGPFRHDLRNVFRRHGFGYYRILNCGLAGCKFVYPGLCLCHSAIADFRHLAVISGSFGIMCLYLVVLDLLSLLLQFGKDSFLFVPTFAEVVPLLIKGLELILDLVHLERHAFASDGLPLDLQLADAAVKLRYRFRNGIHLQAQL